jgi:hypothetical protein
MSASRKRPKAARRRPFGLTTVLLVSLMPTSIGYQDIAALIARQPSVSQRWRQHVLASPFGTIHAATFSFPRPLGASIPEPLGYQLANVDPRSLDITGSIPAEPEPEAPLVYPTVDRSLKGDMLVPRPRPSQPVEEQKPKQPDRNRGMAGAPPDMNSPVEQTAGPGSVSEVAAAPAADDDNASVPKEATAWTPPGEPGRDTAKPTDEDWRLARDDGLTESDDPDVWPRMPVDASDPTVRMARLYFGSDAIGTPVAIQPWADGEQPIVQSRQTNPHIDPDIKRSAISTDLPPLARANLEPWGETVASKGEVAGEGQRPKTPAEQLVLRGPARMKAEKCLADAIYFESRGEPERGQMAVAQVVMNRVFSGFYPDNVCGVVYQNAHRHLACQFTFACEGKRLVVDEPDMWEQAKRIARDTLDGKLWLPEVGKSTHYHASWVRPSWIREMKRNWKFGVHTFYRPRAWGDGSDEPAWGSGAKPIDALPAKSAATDASAGAAKM